MHLDYRVDKGIKINKAEDWRKQCVAKNVLRYWNHECMKRSYFRAKIIANKSSFQFITDLYEVHCLGINSCQIANSQRLAVYKTKLGLNEKSSIYLWLSEAFEMSKEQLMKNALVGLKDYSQSIREFKYSFCAICRYKCVFEKMQNLVCEWLRYSHKEKKLRFVFDEYSTANKLRRKQTLIAAWKNKAEISNDLKKRAAVVKMKAEIYCAKYGLAHWRARHEEFVAMREDMKLAIIKSNIIGMKRGMCAFKTYVNAKYAKRELYNNYLQINLKTLQKRTLKGWNALKEKSKKEILNAYRVVINKPQHTRKKYFALWKKIYYMLNETELKYKESLKLRLINLLRKRVQINNKYQTVIRKSLESKNKHLLNRCLHALSIIC